jgi:hypothetical protein
LGLEEEIATDYPTLPRTSVHLKVLGTSYLHRYSRLGVPQDLDKAISALTEALLHSPSNESSRATTLDSLGWAYLARFNMMRDEIVTAAIDTAQAFRSRAHALGEKLAKSVDLIVDFEETLREAARLFSAAGNAAPSYSPVRVSSLIGYGETLLNRFDITAKRADLESALAIGRGIIVELAGDDGPEAVFSHRVAARALKKLRRINESTAEFRAACKAAAPLSALIVWDVASEWANWAFERGDWTEAAEAMTYLVQAFELLYQAQSLRINFTSAYRRFGLAGRLHYALARCQRHAEAVELLERCRALHLREMTLRDQNVLEQLRSSGYETEVLNYVNRATELRRLELASSTAASGATGPGIDQVRKARDALDKAIGVIRDLPGMRRFHDRISVSELQALAKTEPLVYLSSSPAGGCASIITETGVESIILPELRDDAVREMAKPWFDAEAGSATQAGPRTAVEHVRRLVPWLQRTAMSRLVDALGEIQVATIIPTGLLALFPLHVACLKQGDGDCVGDMSDQLIMRYSPTGEMAAVARSAVLGRSDHSIMTILGSGPGLTTAPFEVSEARRLFAESTEVDCSIEQDPAEAVLHRVAECDVLHIACHARSSTDVLDSRLWLTESSSVTLRQIRAISNSVRLAVLSACETSISETASPDEVVNFCTGLLATGTSGCVGSLWRVADESTSLLMAKFYREWKEGGLTPVASLTSAQLWLSTATNRTLNSFLPEVRMRPPTLGAAALSLWESARPFADPYYWAGFVYVGA